ncbi:TIGR04197 family type VII secretion effector [Enterococcus plantarum]|uniref:TIGR04197 family type VII secretion effector n=1 Tax=Enterococcus plantarum TaxID=1077675 RepID=A0A2W4B8X0_9ENTE|nr:TIGR04197 family type VII secretion effector [Enterococcus plantarum]PZL72645.1 TIGR04197 family type VII secretion effector [Enterococcus plantarum]
MGIKSNVSVAGNVSASFSKSATALNTINASTSVASRTNVTGNASAKQSTIAYGTTLKSLSSSIVSAGDKIHSVAKEFAQIDQKGAQDFQKNLSPMSKWGL